MRSIKREPTADRKMRTGQRPDPSTSDIARSFTRVSSDGDVFERLGRYEMRLWRQTVQTILLLNSINRGPKDYADCEDEFHLGNLPQKTPSCLIGRPSCLPTRLWPDSVKNCRASKSHKVRLHETEADLVRICIMRRDLIGQTICARSYRKHWAPNILCLRSPTSRRSLQPSQMLATPN